MLLVIVLGSITIIAAIVQTLAFKRLYAYVERELSETGLGYLPKVSVILPCKGLDPGFKDNIKRLLAQDYRKNGRSNFEVIFSVAAKSDPAYEALKEVQAEIEGVRTEIVIAGTDRRRAQKINNQLKALEHIQQDSEVIVFVDSDVIARHDFLRWLVFHLEDTSVGVTTGYRFYIPLKGTWAAFLRSMWNRMTAWEMANKEFAFAWGGAMAVRRETFERARMTSVWDTAADDDLSLTTAVKALGLKVRFVPQCLVASDGDGTIQEIIEWTNRQLILTKVYYPGLWRRAINRAVILTFWLMAVLLSLVWGLLTSDMVSFVAVAAGLTLLPVELWFLVKAQKLWRRVLLANIEEEPNAHTGDIGEAAKSKRDSDMSLAFDKCLLRSALLLPVAHLVLPWMTLYSLLTNRIKWRGISYELKSPTETVIVS